MFRFFDQRQWVVFFALCVSLVFPTRANASFEWLEMPQVNTQQSESPFFLVSGIQKIELTDIDAYEWRLSARVFKQRALNPSFPQQFPIEIKAKGVNGQEIWKSEILENRKKCFKASLNQVCAEVSWIIPEFVKHYGCYLEVESQGAKTGFDWGYCKKTPRITPTTPDIALLQAKLGATGDLQIKLKNTGGIINQNTGWLVVAYNFLNQPLYSYRADRLLSLSKNQEFEISLGSLLLQKHVCHVRIVYDPDQVIPDQNKENQTLDQMLGECEEDEAQRFSDVSIDEMKTLYNQQAGFYELQALIFNHGNLSAPSQRDQVGFMLRLFDKNQKTIYELAWKKELHLQPGQSTFEKVQVPDFIYRESCGYVFIIDPSRRLNEWNDQNNFYYQQKACGE